MEIHVAVPTPLEQTFTYGAAAAIEPGTRVMVPFGFRKVVGVVVPPPTESAVRPKSFAIKDITSVIDSAPVYSPVLLKLASWIAAYYMHPIGEVLKAMLPASTKTTKAKVYKLTELGLGCHCDESSEYYEQLRAVFKSPKKPISAAIAKKRIKAAWPDSEPQKIVAALKRAKLIELTAVAKVRARGVGPEAFMDASPNAEGTRPPPLTEEQHTAADAIIRLGLDQKAPDDHKPFLLQGVTGSGKTEVYLALIAHLVAKHLEAGHTSYPQTLILVPEISLTPQMTAVFTNRFPGKVAVVHSAMTDADRWDRLQKIRSGEAQILIGPRSAVFAPFKQLGLVIVDEEHDPSYKQATGLAYNGRDIAIVRAKMEGCIVVLGSATPSLESYWNARSGKYHHCVLTKRVGSRPLPSVETVISRSAASRGVLIKSDQALGEGEGQELPVAPEIVQALRDNLAAGNQAIVLVNRRGYAYYLFDLRERQAYLCKNCSISMTLHARSTVLHCHYCDHEITLRQVQLDNPDGKFVAVGYGSQKAEDCLTGALPQARIARLDSDVVANREVLPATLEKFREGQLDILVGTQILAKGHDFPRVTLIAILEVDQPLNLPDFRAGERTFQLLVQAAGRAGRAELAGRVLVQSARLDHPVIQAGLDQDFEAFANRELDFRRAHFYPPFGKLILMEVTSESEKALSTYTKKISAWVQQAYKSFPEVMGNIRVLGPSVPAIEKIRGRHRRTILFVSPDGAQLRKVAREFWRSFSKVPSGMRIRVDVDPQSLI
jgi:primosomal protein N' (replication factor Y)